jgi:hypothetical protein
VSQPHLTFAADPERGSITNGLTRWRGKQDMVISVGNGRYVLINTGSAFRPTTSSDKISDQEVK